jgi:site-specific DNA recombinase
MKVVIYVRVSSGEQVSGYSLEAQEDHCRQWAAANGYEVVLVYSEPGKSAKTDQRPAFQSAVRFVLAGGADAILVHRADRFARNLFDYLRYRSQLEAQERMILSATETFFNGFSPETRLLASIIMAVAEFIAARIGQETIKGTGQKAKVGKWPGGRPPVGYKRQDKDTIIPDPETGPAISQSFRDFASGRYTLDEWQHEAARRGIKNQGKPMGKPAWHYLFRNVFYTGKFIWNGETIIGDHPALVDEATFETVQELLTSRNAGGKVQKHFWLLSGLLWSDVYHKPMSGSQSGQNRYYRAQGAGPEHAIRAGELEERVISLLREIGWDGQSHFIAPEKWRLAIRAVPNLGMVYAHLEFHVERQEFLGLVFPGRGIRVAAGGAVIEAGLMYGFTWSHHQK